MNKENLRNRHNQILHLWRLEEYFSPLDYPELVLEMSKYEGKRKIKIPFDAYNNEFSMRKLPLEEYKSYNQYLNNKYGKKAKIYDKANIYYGDYKLKDFVGFMVHVCHDIDENQYEEINELKGKFYIFSVQIDLDGKITGEGVKISPFFYAVTQIIFAQTIKVHLDTKKLSDLNDEINEIIKQNDLEILNFEDTLQIKKIIFKKLNINNEGNIGLHKVYKPTLACKALRQDEESNDLSSFYLDEIDLVKQNFNRNQLIQKYVTALENKKIEKIWIDSNINEMKKWLDIDRFPLAKYPSKFSPTLMQQIAINIAISDIDRKEDIFSVNGPPGTGKTTLLKEIIASNVEKMAEVLIELGPHNSKFVKHDIDSTSTPQFIDHFYEIPDKVAQYGILVTSNNNGAVENITLDLPMAESVLHTQTRTDYFDITKHEEIYFTAVANKLMNVEVKDGEETSNNQAWGLISTRMGKKAYVSDVLNCCIFKKNGDPDSKVTLDSIDNNLSWNDAVSSFQSAKQNVLRLKEEIKKDQKIVEQLYIVEKLLKNQVDDLNIKETEKNKKEESLSKKCSEKKENENNTKNYENEIIYIKEHSSLIQRIMIMFGFGNNGKKVKEIYTKIEDLVLKHYHIVEEINNLEDDISIIQNQINELNENINVIKKKYDMLKTCMQSLKEKYGMNFVDKDFYKDIKNSQDSQNACPWTFAEYDKAREELFYKALQVRKVFVLKSPYIKRNLFVYAALNNGQYTLAEKKEMFPHLFNALSVVIPVLSSTFASVGRFLKYADNKSLGMLVIDEAGQATPQSALGALYRSKRAIVVGDPLQIEPVVTIPRVIVNMLADNIGNLKLYKNIENSVQLLADCINEFNGKIGENQVGCPLVVHRRCIEPMFSISNKISYSNRMFNMTYKKEEMLDVNQPFLLKKSGWIHVEGDEKGNKDHFVKAQSDKVCELLEKSLEIYSNLFETEKSIFIISPFRTVCYSLKNEIIKYFTKKGYDKELLKKWVDKCIGTVHTFQGKDAKEVLFVLGCSSKSQGAMDWVVKKPNILNVACTRAKYRIAFIGNINDWKNKNYFKDFIPELINQIHQ